MNTTNENLCKLADAADAIAKIVYADSWLNEWQISDGVSIEEIADFIKAANPAKVKELLDRIDSLTLALSGPNNFCRSCGKHTPADTIHTCSPQYAVEQSYKFEQGYRRYEIIRKMNVPQFKDLYKKSISGEDSFDSLVDAIEWDKYK